MLIHEDIIVQLPARKKGESIVFAQEPVPGTESVVLPCSLFSTYGALALFAVGSFFAVDSVALLRSVRRQYYMNHTQHMLAGVVAVCLQDIVAQEYCLQYKRVGFSLAVLTVSDKGAAGVRVDESAPLIVQQVAEVLPLATSDCFIVPDDIATVRGFVAELALVQGYDLVITTGGTGLSARDTTPEAVTPLFDRSLPGMAQAMMAAALCKTPHAVLSRAVAGTIGESLVLTLPGSKKAVQENLAAVLPSFAHALHKLQGDTSDCGKS